MANLSVKRFSWVTNPTVWQSNQAWRARQQQLRGDFESASSAASSALASASLNQVTGLGSIAAQIANKRIQQQAIQRQLNLLA